MRRKKVNYSIKKSFYKNDTKKSGWISYIVIGNRMLIVIMLLYLLIECTIGGHKDVIPQSIGNAKQWFGTKLNECVMNRVNLYESYIQSGQEIHTSSQFVQVSLLPGYLQQKESSMMASVATKEAKSQNKENGTKKNDSENDKKKNEDVTNSDKESGEDKSNDIDESKQDKETSKGTKNDEDEELAVAQADIQLDENVMIPKPELTGVNYSIEQLQDFDFLLGKFYVVDSSTVVYEKDFPVKKMLKKDFSLKQDNSKPQILIYHTHSQEGFSDTVEGDKDTTIIGVGDYLTEILTEQFGYNVIHNTDTFDLVDGVLDRSKAYDYAEKTISQVLADYPSIELVIDLHRDGVREDLHLVTEVNGKQTAQIMFFNGMSRLKDIGEIEYLNNPYRMDNLALTLQLKLKAESYYPGFTRRNYINAYEYNLHLKEKCMLIEAGAQTNSVQEVKNAMEPLAMLIHMVLDGE